MFCDISCIYSIYKGSLELWIHVVQGIVIKSIYHQMETVTAELFGYAVAVACQYFVTKLEWPCCLWRYVGKNNS